ncbi:uncharacterized protein LOC124775600 [Schistocerca piceifrons]|uniref:uncharacterized protein LOC124775600 n=1 Tax=Schistocerca piceifrons TaxID=274613 RepID=UPI001F5F9C41|nr:uncharacterized protein LOC124775600 [Schistocerca piceifrons]
MADTKIPVFDGEDYGNWKRRMEMYLKMKKCYTVVSTAKTSMDKADTWEEENLIAMNYIYGAISNKQLEFVSDKETAFEIMKKSDDLYCKLCAETTCAKVTEKEKLNYMLRTLAETLSCIGNLIDVLKEEDQTVEYVKSKLQLTDLKEKDGSECVKSNAFRAEKNTSMSYQEQLCYGCGKPGHIRRDFCH